MMSENIVRGRIKRKLHQKGWWVIKITLASIGGWPDLLCLRMGRIVFIEVKAEGKRPSPLQYAILEKLSSYGFLAFWTDNPNDLKGIELWE